MRKTMQRAARVMAVASMFALANCGGGDGAGDASCRGLVNKLRDCGLWEGGNANCQLEPETAYVECVARCVQDSSCSKLESYQCGSGSISCLNACVADDFVCDNGQHIDPRLQCDGQTDCSDGSDEDQRCDIGIFHCGGFKETIPSEWVCDGQEDCADESDETDCGADICPSNSASAPQSLLLTVERSPRD